MSGYILIGLSMLCAVGSQLLFKSGLETIGGLEFNTELVSQGIRLLTNWRVITGLTIYGFGWLMWMMALSRFDLSFAYPFTSLNYVLVLLLSWTLLGEPISPVRALGVVVVCLGLFIISRGG